jgi:hypothetical protein
MSIREIFGRNVLIGATDKVIIFEEAIDVLKAELICLLVVVLNIFTLDYGCLR